MESWKLRVHDVDFDVSIILSTMSRWMYCQEGLDGDIRPHRHFYFETDLKRDTIIKRIQKISTYQKGNRYYSLGKLRKDKQGGYTKYLAYITKQGDYQSKGFTESEITQIQLQDQEIKKSIKENRSKDKTIIQQIETEYFSEVREGNVHDQIDEYTKELSEVSVTKQYVVNSVVRHFKLKNLLVRQFMMVSISQTLCLKYVNSYDYHLVNSIMEKL